MSETLRRRLPAMLLLLGALLGALLVLGTARALGLKGSPPFASPLTVEPVLPLGEGEVGPYGPIEVHFNRSLDPDSLPGRIRIDGERVEDYRLAAGGLTIRLDVPLRPGDHQLVVENGIAGTGGATLKADGQIPFRVRQPEVIFLQVGEGTRTLLRTDDGGAVSLSGPHSVLDFAAERDGAGVVYAATNEQGGADLWRVDRQGEERHLLLACGGDRCYQPAWSADGERVAFTRQSTDDNGEIHPRLWTLELSSGSAAPLYTDGERAGRSPRWSPDGRWLAYYDPRADVVVLLDTDTVREQVVTTRSGLPVAWSPDSEDLLTPTLQLVHERPQLTLLRVEPAAGTITEILGPQDGWLEVGVPSWSPAGDRIALSAVRREDGLRQGIWLVAPSGQLLTTVAADPAYSYGGPTWDPWGESLLFSRFALGLEGARPQLMRWRVASQQALLLGEGAAGRWFP